jgi:hypothetical protein
MTSRNTKLTVHYSGAYRFVFFSWFVLLFCSLLYVSYFYGALDNNEWLDVNGFTRILIPDSFLYIDLVQDIDDIEPGKVAVAGVKNAVGPVLMWLAGGSDWYGMAVVNSLLALVTGRYTIKICEHFQLSPERTFPILAILMLTPVIMYYCVGPAKELPTLTALTGFFYHFLKQHRCRWILAAAAVVLFRYQLFAVLIPFIAITRFSKNPLRNAVHLMLAAAVIYPVISQLGITNPAESENFREGSEGQLGAVIEYVRNSIPVASAPAALLHVLQSVLEPIVNVLRSTGFYEDGSISVISFVYFVSLLPVLPYWYRAVVRLVRLYKVKQAIEQDIMSLYVLIVLFVVPVGGFSFVHHRYLFPITALILIAGHSKAGGMKSQYEHRRNSAWMVSASVAPKSKQGA